MSYLNLHFKSILIISFLFAFNNLTISQTIRGPYPTDPNRGVNATKADANSEEQDNQSQAYQSLSLAVLADPNAVIQASDKYPDLVEAIEKIDRTGMSERNAWGSRRATSYRPLASTLQRQLKSELDLITTFAASEDANATKAVANETLTRWDTRFGLISEELRRLRREQRMGQQIMQQRRMRGRNREENQNLEPAQPQDQTTPEYDVSPWLNSNMDNRKELSTSINDELMTDYGKILASAKRENADKTTLAVESIIIARGKRFSELQKAYDRNNMPQTMTTRDRNERIPRRGDQGANYEENQQNMRRRR